MELSEYRTMYEVESGHWWYVGLRRLVLDCLRSRDFGKRPTNVLDAGCGTGRMLEQLGHCRSYGLDLSEEALKFCRLRDLKNLLRASVCDMPYRDHAFDLAISLDVISHVDVELDAKILSELHRVLKKEGTLILNLPAYKWLQSTHDKAVHIKHRYTRQEVRSKVEAAGFVIDLLTYRDSFLLPVAILVRLLKKMSLRGTSAARSDLTLLPLPVNRFLTGLLLLENALIMRGLHFPFGLSLFCVARK